MGFYLIKQLFHEPSMNIKVTFQENRGGLATLLSAGHLFTVELEIFYIFFNFGGKKAVKLENEVNIVRSSIRTTVLCKKDKK